MNLNQLFTNAPRLTSLNLSHTNINSTMPETAVLSTTNLEILDLSSTPIDFCSQTRTPWTSSTLDSCNLEDTSASNCQSAYPSQCSITFVQPPLAAPAPQILPASVPISCSSTSQPTPGFQCIGNVWTFTGTIVSTTLVIPSGSSQVVVNGNLTSAAVLINGLGTTLTINGCATNLTTVIIQLTEEQVKQLGSTRTLQTLVELSNTTSCVSSLEGVAVEAKVTHGCRRVNTESQVSSDGKTLSSFFSVDSSGCHRWWIILVSVVCGGIVIAVAAVILLAIISPKFRECIRPYSRRRGARSTIGQ